MAKKYEESFASCSLLPFMADSNEKSSRCMTLPELTTKKNYNNCRPNKHYLAVVIVFVLTNCPNKLNKCHSIELTQTLKSRARKLLPLVIDISSLYCKSKCKSN